MKHGNIEEGIGSLLQADVEALVNTVNTVGVMGKGVALQFKQAFPENFRAYERACQAQEVQPGRMFVFERDALFGPRYIVNFPTKRHWRHSARLEDIETGLEDLVRVVKRLGLRSIALPPLGCGLGGLRWSDVRPRIERALGGLTGVRVVLFAPAGRPDEATMPVNTRKPKMTEKVAALLYVFERYAMPGYKLGRVEAQKLAYFVQVAGVPLGLKFKKHHYGPYAETLNHWLQNLEGHYVRGYGDRSGGSSMVVTPEGRDKLTAKLADEPEVAEEARQVGKLIEGFESPYGLELLATVHWVVANDGVSLHDDQAVLAAVKGWNSRKARVFRDDHVRKAVEQVRTWAESGDGASPGTRLI